MYIYTLLPLLELSSCLYESPGPEYSPPSLVKTALTPLASVGSSFQYPPINWSAVLSPLMRLSFGKFSEEFSEEFSDVPEEADPLSRLFPPRRGRAAPVSVPRILSGSDFPECISLPGLLAGPTSCAQPQCKFFLSNIGH